MQRQPITRYVIRKEPAQPRQQEDSVWKIFDDMGSSLDKMGEDAFNLV